MKEHVFTVSDAVFDSVMPGAFADGPVSTLVLRPGWTFWPKVGDRVIISRKTMRGGHNWKFSANVELVRRGPLRLTLMLSRVSSVSTRF